MFFDTLKQSMFKVKLICSRLFSKVVVVFEALGRAALEYMNKD